MRINLNALVFENDFCFVSLEKGNVLVFNRLDEDLLYNEEETKINKVNLALVEFLEDGTERQTIISSVIGLNTRNDIFLTTDYNEFLGKTLDKENLPFCYIEVNNEA